MLAGMGNAVACDLPDCDRWARDEQRAGWILVGVLDVTGNPYGHIAFYFCSLDHAGQWSIEHAINAQELAADQ